LKYVPRPVDHSVNAPNARPLWELFKFSVRLIVLVSMVYLILGWFVDWVAPLISPRQEERLSQAILRRLPSSAGPPSATQKKVQALLERTLRTGAITANYRVVVLEKTDPNAMAFPGGIIGVTTGLLKSVESENELVMVLGHEVGHFHHRDHLRGLGRGLLLALLLLPITGSDANVSRLININLSHMHSRYSQTQELAADRYGFDLLMNVYGHAGGVSQFFARSAKKENRWLKRLPGNTHPASSDRAKIFETRIRDEKLPVKPVVPLSLRVSQSIN